MKRSDPRARCRIVELNVKKLGEAVANPLFNELLDEGWRVVLSPVVQVHEEDDPVIQAVLCPPPPVLDQSPAQDPPPWMRMAVVGAVVLGVASGLSSALVVLLLG